MNLPGQLAAFSNEPILVRIDENGVVHLAQVGGTHVLMSLKAYRYFQERYRAALLLEVPTASADAVVKTAERFQDVVKDLDERATAHKRHADATRRRQGGRLPNGNRRLDGRTRGTR